MGDSPILEPRPNAFDVSEWAPAMLAASALGFIAYGLMGRVDGEFVLTWTIAASVLAVVTVALALQIGVPALVGGFAQQADADRLRRSLEFQSRRLGLDEDEPSAPTPPAAAS